MKTNLWGWKKIFSGICIVVFVTGHTFSVYSALHTHAQPVLSPAISDVSSDSSAVTSLQSSSESSALSSLLSSSSAPMSILPASSIPNVLTNSKYKATSEDKKHDPAITKPADSDRNDSPPLKDTVPKKDVITAVTPYVIKITGDKVRLRTSMSTEISTNIYVTVNTNHRLLCIADCTSKTGYHWLQVQYNAKILFVSAEWAKATGESPDILNSKPVSTSSSSISSGSSVSSSAASATTSSTPGSSSASASSSAATSSTIHPPYGLQGWQTISGKTYYYVNGKPVTGWQVIGGMRHLFDNAGVKISKAGIDVSRYQGNINWQSVKEAGIDFAIIRVGYRGYGTGKLVLDEYFEKNMKGAAAAGIPCGVYIYSTAISVAEAVEEAAFTISAVKKYKLIYPIMYDVERATDRCAGMTKKQFTDNTIAFLETVKKAGYKAMYYTYRNFLQNYLDYNRLKNYDLWLAMYTNSADDAPIANYNYKIWQYSSTGKVAGISGNVDINIQIKSF